MSSIVGQITITASMDVVRDGEIVPPEDDEAKATSNEEQ